jgi:hypothetical protein
MEDKQFNLGLLLTIYILIFGSAAHAQTGASASLAGSIADQRGRVVAGQ